MINRDYHHHTLDQALENAAKLIDIIRLDNKPDECRFITGYGIIREQLFSMLESYGLEPSYEINNPGAIICYIE